MIAQFRIDLRLRLGLDALLRGSSGCLVRWRREIVVARPLLVLDPLRGARPHGSVEKYCRRGRPRGRLRYSVFLPRGVTRGGHDAGLLVLQRLYLPIAGGLVPVARIIIRQCVGAEGRRGNLLKERLTAANLRDLARGHCGLYAGGGRLRSHDVHRLLRVSRTTGRLEVCVARRRAGQLGRVNAVYRLRRVEMCCVEGTLVATVGWLRGRRTWR